MITRLIKFSLKFIFLSFTFSQFSTYIFIYILREVSFCTKTMFLMLNTIQGQEMRQVLNLIAGRIALPEISSYANCQRETTDRQNMLYTYNIYVGEGRHKRINISFCLKNVYIFILRKFVLHASKLLHLSYFGSHFENIDIWVCKFQFPLPQSVPNWIFFFG